MIDFSSNSQLKSSFTVEQHLASLCNQQPESDVAIKINQCVELLERVS